MPPVRQEDHLICKKNMVLFLTDCLGAHMESIEHKIYQRIDERVEGERNHTGRLSRPGEPAGRRPGIAQVGKEGHRLHLTYVRGDIRN
jgi:hypothetical protein